MSRASDGHWIRIVLNLVAGSYLLLFGGYILLRPAQTASRPTEQVDAKQTPPPTDEQTALNTAFRSAENNPQVLIKNLEAFLVRFPHSSRREIVLRTICAYALEANDPGVIVQYGQMLLEITPNDPKLLNMLIEALTRQNDQPSRIRAIEYASRLLKIAGDERDRAAGAGTGKRGSEPWQERVAALYAQRAGLYRDSGDRDNAFADSEKSLATYPTSRVAEQLGDAALVKGDGASALDYYLTAFVLSDKGLDLAHLQQIRRKLGSLYVAQHHSGKGLGDLVLSREDELMPLLAARSSGGDSQNAGRQDPFGFVLERLDGTPLPLSGYRGRVIVVDFWATWCGPCRLQGKLVDQVAETFRANPDAAFLSLNVDQDRGGVPGFLKQQGWTVPVAYAQGLDQLLKVSSLPTLVIFDRQGRIVYREDGVDPQSFAAELTRHLHEILQETSGSK